MFQAFNWQEFCLIIFTKHVGDPPAITRNIYGQNIRTRQPRLMVLPKQTWRSVNCKQSRGNVALTNVTVTVVPWSLLLFEILVFNWDPCSSWHVSWRYHCRTPVLGLGLRVDFTFAWDNNKNHKNHNHNNPHLNFVKGTVLGDKEQGIWDKG